MFTNGIASPCDSFAPMNRVSNPNVSGKGKVSKLEFRTWFLEVYSSSNAFMRDLWLKVPFRTIH